MRPRRIPLFPLEVVLFPGAALPLHIFEPRYKLMIKRCRDTHGEFGVILSKSEGIVPVGCTAEIIAVVKAYEDGRLDILTFGRVPFHVTEVFDAQPYLEAEVEYLEDDPAPGPAETRERLLALLDRCYALIYGRSPHALDAGMGALLSYQIASELPLDLDFKQELLEIRAEPERQSRLLDQLEHWLPQLAQLNRARGLAGGNGHGLR